MEPNIDVFSAFGSAANGGSIDEKMQKQLMEEEAAAMEKFRAGASASNPFASAPAQGSEETPNILDLFGVAAPAGGAAPPQPGAGAAAASDDLLQLSGNPFANMLNAAGAASNNSFAAAAPTSNPMFPPASTGKSFIFILYIHLVFHLV